MKGEIQIAHIRDITCYLSRSLVLILTNSEDTTADYVGAKIANRFPFIRINTDVLRGVSLEFDFSESSLKVDGTRVLIRNIRSIWYRRPESIPKRSDDLLTQHRGREFSAALEGLLALVPARLWINHPSCNAIASYKIEQLARARRFGLSVPNTIVTMSASRLRSFWEKCSGSVVVKPLFAGYIENQSGDCDWVIYTSQVNTEHITRADLTLPNCPTLFQELVRKSYDVRVTIVDNTIWAIKLSEESGQQPRLDVRSKNMQGIRHELICLPDEIRRLLRRLLDSYSLRYAAVDFVVDEHGNWLFLEINPNGQWAWQDVLGVTDISSQLIEALWNT